METERKLGYLRGKSGLPLVTLVALAFLSAQITVDESGDSERLLYEVAKWTAINRAEKGLIIPKKDKPITRIGAMAVLRRHYRRYFGSEV